MTNNHPLRRHQTIRQLLLAGHRGEVQLIFDSFNDPDFEVRHAALDAAWQADVLTAQEIQRFLADDRVEVRRRAAQLAARLTPSKELVRIVETTLDDDPVVVEMGCFALGEFELPNDRTVAKLANVAKSHDDALCREAAIAALGALHQGRETILGALSDKATVRRRAVIALAPFDGPDIDAALESALNDRDWQVRQAAEDLIGPTEAGPAETNPPPLD